MIERTAVLVGLALLVMGEALFDVRLAIVSAGVILMASAVDWPAVRRRR
jgi:hypothetical protein